MTLSISDDRAKDKPKRGLAAAAVVGNFDNVLPAVQAHFVATYRAAGGEIDYEVFPGAEHRWIIQPGLQKDRAIEMIKAFIARQLHARQLVG